MISVSSPSPLYRPLFRALIWYLLVSLPSSFGCSPQGRTFLRSFSLDVGMLSKSFFPFRFPSSLFYIFFFLSFSVPSSSPPASSVPTEIFPSLGCVLSGISHIHHVITVIFSALRHVTLSVLLFYSSELRICGTEIHKKNYIWLFPKEIDNLCVEFCSYDIATGGRDLNDK